jgi:hypothetical protein
MDRAGEDIWIVFTDVDRAITLMHVTVKNKNTLG